MAWVLLNAVSPRVWSGVDGGGGGGGCLFLHRWGGGREEKEAEGEEAERDAVLGITTHGGLQLLKNKGVAFSTLSNEFLWVPFYRPPN